MYKATYIFEGRCVGEQRDEDLYDFPKKGENHAIGDCTYYIKSFTILGTTIIYLLDNKR